MLRPAALRLVCICGIDGTGKTTLARGLVEALQRQGLPAVYLYGRTYPVISRLLMALGRRTMLRGRDQWSDYAGYTASKKSVMRQPWLAWVYRAAILCDYYPQMWLKLHPHLLTGRIVVCDR
jgi:thymidylate kinase